jgi:hypothetical protein
MNGDAPIAQDPTVGKTHFGRAIVSLELDMLSDHQRVFGFSPESDVYLQTFDPEDALKVLAQLFMPAKIFRLFLEAADQDRVGRVLVQDALDVVLENQVDVFFVEPSEFGVWRGAHSDFNVLSFSV